MNKKSPPNRLRVLRAEHRLSQMDVAAYLSCGHHRYWRIENGFQIPSDREERLLCRLFKKPVEEIFVAVAA